MMELLRTGDPCPCCGQPIKTKDPDLLYLLTWIGSMRRLPMAEEMKNIHEEMMADDYPSGPAGHLTASLDEGGACDSRRREYGEAF